MGVGARARQGAGEAIPGTGTWQSRQQVGRTIAGQSISLSPVRLSLCHQRDGNICQATGHNACYRTEANRRITPRRSTA